MNRFTLNYLETMQQAYNKIVQIDRKFTFVPKLVKKNVVKWHNVVVRECQYIGYKA